MTLVAANGDGDERVHNTWLHTVNQKKKQRKERCLSMSPRGRRMDGAL